MAAVFTSALFCILTSGVLASGACSAAVGANDETCLLQQTNEVLQQRDAVLQQEKSEVTRTPGSEAAETARGELAAALKSKRRRVIGDYAGGELPRMVLLQTQSAVESSQLSESQDQSFLNFHNPRVWGPAAWFFFHSMALGQEDEIGSEQQERLRRFFTEDLSELLPCPTCGKNAHDHIQAMKTVGFLDNTTFSSRDRTAEFVWTLHNMVNVEKNRSTVPWDRAVLNLAQAYEQNATLLHFNNSHVEATPAEHHRVELLTAPRPAAAPAAPAVSRLSRLLRVFSSLR